MNLSVDKFSYDRQTFEQTITYTLVRDMELWACGCMQSGQRFYALIDASQCDDIEETRQNDNVIVRLIQRHDLKAEALFRHTAEAALAEAGPWLIELPMPPGGNIAPLVLQDLAHAAGLPQALSLIASPLRLALLAEHLRSWLDGMILADPSIAGDEAAGAVVRWFDPRIGFDMVGLWSVEHQADFMRPFSWAAWDASFHPVGIPCSQPRAPASAVRAEPLPLHKDLLLALVPLNRAEDLLAEMREQTRADAFEHIPSALQRWVALAQVQATQQLGIADRESQLTLLHQALSLHPGISRLSGLKEGLDQEARRGCGIAHLLHGMPAEWWQQQRIDANDVWAQWAHNFLLPLQTRQNAIGHTHPFATLLSLPQ